MNKYFLFIIFSGLILSYGKVLSAEPSNLEEVNIYESLKKTGDTSDANITDVKMSTPEEEDDLQSLKDDIGDIVSEDDKKDAKEMSAIENKDKEEAKEKVETKIVGEEKLEEAKKETKDFALEEDDEKKMLSDMAKNVRQKISSKEWNEILAGTKITEYTTQKGETLKSIAKKLFGSEEFYSRIWARNPQISNPYVIEPGTVLAFDIGDEDAPPNVQLGEFSEDETSSSKNGDSINLPPWLNERKKLIDQGVYFQFASEETYEDLERLEKAQKNLEYEKYDPPISAVTIQEPAEQYDETGFDKTSKLTINFKEGFFLNSFVTTNVVQDLGEIKAAVKESLFINKYDNIYVNFDKTAKVKPGDLFSVYTMGGEIKNPISDRSGFLYTTTAQIKTVRKIDNLWECSIVEQSGLVQRQDRITTYTPKIGKIVKTYGKRNVEAAIIGTYRETVSGISFGDVVYLDRGRADGVELGNIFQVYSFVDRGTQKKITPSPTYKVGELTVINITDNFATALITNSSNEIGIGSIAITKTQEDALRETRLKNKDKLKDVTKVEGKALDELDVELNLDDVSQDILNKADKIQLTEDEIEELERQERDKSIIKDSERDVRELDRLEGEIQDTEKSLNESKVDEDKFLEQSSLDEHEKKAKDIDPNAFESINEIEKDVGRKYLDEEINNKENPYGLTEFDLEEVDELLNTGSKK